MILHRAFLLTIMIVLHQFNFIFHLYNKSNSPTKEQFSQILQTFNMATGGESEAKTPSECCPWFNLCRWFCNEPRLMFKVLLFMVGFAVVLYQVTTCSMKLKTKADATHTFLAVNNSLYYPAITFCQEPPFRIGHNLLDSSVEEKPKDMHELLQLWQNTSLKQELPINFEKFQELITSVTFSVEESIEEMKFNGDTTGMRCLRGKQNPIIKYS